MKKLHENVRVKIEKANEKYKKKANKNRRTKSIEPGGLVAFEKGEVSEQAQVEAHAKG